MIKSHGDNSIQDYRIIAMCRYFGGPINYFAIIIADEDEEAIYYGRIHTKKR